MITGYTSGILQQGLCFCVHGIKWPLQDYWDHHWDRNQRRILCPTVLMFEEVYSRSLCRTIEKLVEVVQEYPTEVEHIYSPSCVPLVRCAGCCGDEKLECHPTTTTNVTMQVSETQALRDLRWNLGKAQVLSLIWQVSRAETCSHVKADHRVARQPGKLSVSLLCLLLANQTGSGEVCGGIHFLPRYDWFVAFIVCSRSTSASCFSCWKSGRLSRIKNMFRWLLWSIRHVNVGKKTSDNKVSKYFTAAEFPLNLLRLKQPSRKHKLCVTNYAVYFAESRNRPWKSKGRKIRILHSNYVFHFVRLLLNMLLL